MPHDADVPIESLADVFRWLRGADTQQDFAARVGMSAPMVGHVEAGRRSISVAVVERVADSLKLNRSDRERLRAARDRATADLATRPVAPVDEVTRLLDVTAELARAVLVLADRAGVKLDVELLRAASQGALTSSRPQRPSRQSAP